MYRYDEIDRTLVAQRVAQFRDQTQRFLAGALSEDEFRPLRLRNGLYIQRFAPMLRISIPYGLLSTRQLRKLADITRRYDRNFGHFTTRQNLQLNWPKLEQVPDILAELASVDMHAMQTSGNCIRNITSDHLAGVVADEIADPRPYCEIIRQWATLHPEFSYLPRKFKIAVIGSPRDRAATLIHDIGVFLRRRADGKFGYEIAVGGGLGRTPIIGQVVREFLPEEHLLSYLEAILRIYNLLGRRDNIHKARIKILVRALGIERFRALVEEEWSVIDRQALALSPEAIGRMQAHFSAPPYQQLEPHDPSVGKSAAFQAWYRHNTDAHKVPGYRIVHVSLKAPGAAPGDASSEQMDLVSDLADRYSFGLVRVTHRQNLVLADVAERDVETVWRALDAAALATPNIGTLTDIICCPGLDYCSLANAAAIPIALAIGERFENLDHQYDLGEIEIKISGCMNACGHHHVGHIGILGVDKGGAEWYQITLGGAAGERTALGEVIGPSVPRAEVAETIGRILDVYVEQRTDDERFVDTVWRLGIAPFKERVYANTGERERRRA
jgi:sulfite reductase (NADPH) hemoprotein beta-component